MLTQRCARLLSLRPRYDSLIDRSNLPFVQPPRRSTQSLGVYDGRLFDEDPRLASGDRDRGSEARRPGASRRGGDERRRQVEELVRLHHDGVAGASLLMPSGTSWSREMEHLPADHLSPPVPEQVWPFARG